MIDGTKCVSDWMIHRHGPSTASCDHTQFSVWWKFGSKFGQRTTCSRLMWRPSVIDWWDNAWYWRDYVRHSSRFILPETIEMYSCKVRQLWSIDVFQPGVNVKLNVIFYLLWTATSCWWWGAPATSSELFSESGLNSTVREQGSTSIFQKHLRRREQMSRETTIYRRPSTVDPERHSAWSTEPARRFVVGSHEVHEAPCPL